MLTNRAFTLIELMLIIVCLVLIVAVVAPRMESLKESGEYRAFRIGVRRLASEARELAISRGEPVSVSLNESEGTIQIQSDSADAQQASLRSLQIAPGVQATRCVAGDVEANPAEWRLQFYPDGRSDGGGVQFEAENDTFYLMADERGVVRFDDGQLPNMAAQRWQAGEYERRQ